MDKELAQLHDYARELLVGLEDDLIVQRKATGREPSLLKKVRKAVSIWTLILKLTLKLLSCWWRC